MNKFIKIAVISALAMTLCSNAMAAFVLNGTRFVYEEGKKNTSFEVTNNADETYGGQIWVDNSNQGDGVYMITTPPFFKIGPKQKQIARILRTDTPLPTDRESLFWLNVQEIPPKPKNEDGNLLSVAVNTRVKLFFRPKSIIDGRKGAEKKIKVIHQGNNSFLSNPTPYYFAVVGVAVNGQPLKLDDAEQNALAVLEPFGKASLGKDSLNGKVTVDAVNDWGATESFDLQG